MRQESGSLNEKTPPFVAVIQRDLKMYPIQNSYNGFYWVLLGFTEFYLVFYLVLKTTLGASLGIS